MKKIKFEKKGKTATVSKNKNWEFTGDYSHNQQALRFEWNGEEGYVTGVKENKNVINLSNVWFKGQEVDGMKVDNEIKGKIEELQEKVIEESKKKMKSEETIMMVREMEYGRGYKTKVKIFEYNGKSVDEEEREKLNKIEEVLGRKKIRGTGINGIKADRFEEDQKFTVEELYEKVREEIEEKKEKEEQKEEEVEEKREKAIKEAKEKGEEVIVRKIGRYDGDAERPGEELGWVNVYEVAKSDGEIKKEEMPTY